MTLEQVMNLTWDQINKMNLKELKAATKVVGDVANKRLMRLEKNDYIAKQALDSLTKSGGKITVGGKNVNQLRGEINRARAFINMKTSRIRDAKAVYKARDTQFFGSPAKNKEELKRRKAMSEKISELYDKYLELDPASKYKIGACGVRDLAIETVTENPNLSVDELIEIMENKYNDAYIKVNDEKFEFGRSEL